MFQKRKGIDIAIKNSYLLINLLGHGIILLITNCNSNVLANSYTSTNHLTPHSCIKHLNPKLLDLTLEQCHQVVKKFPDNPLPLNDRSLIYTLMGNNKSACLDVKKASMLLDQSNDEIDELTAYEIKVRQDSCMQRRNKLDTDSRFNLAE